MIDLQSPARQTPEVSGLLRRLSLVALSLPLLALTGCAGAGWGSGIGLPNSWQQLGEAARDAAIQPSVWAPMAGALVIGVTNTDDDITDWAVRKQPLFGSNAADVSDDLLDVSLGVWALSALAARSDSATDKALGLGVQAGSIVFTGGVSEGLKSLTSRERPNGENDNSLPSGHASQAAVRTHWARTNLAAMGLSSGVQTTGNVALHTLGYATGWARVEANKHHPSDVLAGIALGNFFAEFFRRAVFDVASDAAPPLQLQVVPGGAQLHFSRALD